jgi:hypothetical protein
MQVELLEQIDAELAASEADMDDIANMIECIDVGWTSGACEADAGYLHRPIVG